ncbi:MAG: type II toxin-antitoxin system RelE/ParE family toxin [bacterium]
MKLAFTKSFKEDYQSLPENVQQKVDKQLKFLIKDRDYPSLQAKKMQGHPKIWEARVSRSYRFTFQIEGNVYLLRRVGTHDILQNP